jgi:hypothetical protein
MKATIQYAPKPWDRGRPPLTRTVEIPKGYTAEQAEAWLREKQLLKAGEIILSFNN